MKRAIPLIDTQLPGADCRAALAAHGRWAEARAKYDAALPYAPKWRALLDARAAAAGHLPRSG